jgi:hypothetical protein
MRWIVAVAVRACAVGAIDISMPSSRHTPASHRHEDRAGTVRASGLGKMRGDMDARVIEAQ